MPAFEYSVLDRSGKKIKGVEEGDTARQVRQGLRERGLTPLSVEEIKQRKKERPRFGFSVGNPRVSVTNLALITRQLATLVRSAIPLEEALLTVANQVESHRLKSVLLSVRSRVLEGFTLADGLDDFPTVFPELYRSTVAAGEQAGHLDMVLERLADYSEKHQQLRQKIQLALLYPSLLTVVAVAITIGLFAYVVPQVVQVFESIDQQLPVLTLALIAISDALRAYGLFMLLGLIVLAYVLKRLSKREGFRLRWHAFLHRMPLIGRLFRGLNTARFARTLSILGASGVPVLDAMRIAGAVVSSMPMRASVERAAELVREGKGIAVALEREKQFPPMLVQLIASGESTGKLEVMLERAADTQERELETLIAALLGVFEPIMILFMGALVMVIVLAILLPIFELNQLVK
ncbi:MAG: type II secretion system inner membrane protein GspF [Chromatiaceae bacterium]|nr:type II secretion system inner membrane protein GspF [Chromatiaceae bacterium]